jgi:hypothetical protein
MGIIVSGIKLIKPAYDFCLQMTEKVNTCRLQKQMECLVQDCFATLKPLSSSLKTVTRASTPYGTREILIGEWIREKSGHQKLGSLVGSNSEVFSLIRQHGEQMKPLARRTISNEFSQLVDLAKQLISYKDLMVRMDIPPTEVFEHQCYGYEGDEPSMAIESAVLIAVAIETQDPNEIFLFKEGGKEPESRELNDEKKTPLFEDIISYLVELFKKADAQVSLVRNHNEKIMEQMKQIVAPLKIANSIKG